MVLAAIWIANFKSEDHTSFVKLASVLSKPKFALSPAPKFNEFRIRHTSGNRGIINNRARREQARKNAREELNHVA